MTTQFAAISLKATTARGIEAFQICDEPEAEFCGNLDSFLSACRSLDDDEVAYYQVLPAGTDGEYEKIEAEYGIR